MTGVKLKRAAIALALCAAVTLAGCAEPGAVVFEEPVNVKVNGAGGGDPYWAEEGEFGSHVISERAQLDSELEEMRCIVRPDGSYAPRSDAAYYEEVLGRFDDAFFDEHVLVDAHAEFGSGGQRFDVSSVVVRGGRCTVTLSLRPMTASTHDMAYYCVLVPVARESVEGVDEVAVEYAE